MPEPFETIRARAVENKGKQGLEASFAKPRSPAALARRPDAEVLSEMGKIMFSAGFSWRVVEQKWPAFEEAFRGFDPKQVAGLSDRELDTLAQDKALIRNRGKIGCLRDNAAYCQALAEEYGSAAKFLAAWPGDDITGLWLELKQNGSRLGGATGPRALRALGKDTFILTPDVLKGLKKAGVKGPSATSKAGLAAAQAAFNSWHDDSGLPLCVISRVLACSTG